MTPPREFYAGPTLHAEVTVRGTVFEDRSALFDSASHEEWLFVVERMQARLAAGVHHALRLPRTAVPMADPTIRRVMAGIVWQCR